MSYFSKFPQFITKVNGSTYVTRDFTRRVTLAEKFQENSVLLDDYIVGDGETPDMISYQLYGNPGYHWIILIVNNIIDPREEWPIKNSLVIEKLYLKYDFVITVPSGSEYSEGDELTSSNNKQFLVSSVSGNTVYIRSQTGFVPLSTSDTLNNVTTEVTGLTITSVTLPENRIHHYYDTVLGYMVDYDPANLNIVPVTNFEYEMEMNDAKRNVKVLNPSLLNNFITVFKKEINK